MNATGLVNSPIAIMMPPTNSMMPASPLCDISATACPPSKSKQLLRAVLRKRQAGHDPEKGVKVGGKGASAFLHTAAYAGRPMPTLTLSSGAYL